MKKRTLGIIGVVTGIALLAVSGLSNASGMTGYEEMKSAVRAHLKLKNYTVSIEGKLYFDGRLAEEISKELAYADGISQDSGSTVSLLSNGESRTSKSYIYSAPDTMIHGYANNIEVQGDEMDYFVRRDQAEVAISSSGIEHMTDDVIRLYELAVDALSGNLKDIFIKTENEDGSEISAKMIAIQTPEVVNVALSAILRDSHRMNWGDEPYPVTSDIKGLIKNGPHVENAHFTAQLNDDGLLESVDIYAQIAGKDDAGSIHNAELEGRLVFTAIGETMLSAPDLTGKNVRYNDRMVDTEELRRLEELRGNLQFAADIMEDNEMVRNEIYAEINRIAEEISQLYKN